MAYIKWGRLWNKFEKWLEEKEDGGYCRECYHKLVEYPEWDEQQKKIKELVEEQLEKHVSAWR